MIVENQTENSKMEPVVTMTGTATEGCYGPQLGLVDIGVSERAYIFRVALPGINQDKFKCTIGQEGKVCIHGFVPETTALNDSSSVYRMRVQQLCSSGPFTITFYLPGPVDPRLFSPKFRPDGILECVIAKFRGQFPTPS